jgi:hypothetical protein
MRPSFKRRFSYCLSFHRASQGLDSLSVAQAQPIPLKALAAVAIIACILSAGVSAVVTRWDLGSVSHAAALEAAKQVSSRTTTTAMNMMDDSSTMMSMMMGMGKNGMTGARAHSMMGHNNGSMMNGPTMGMRGGTMMGQGASSMMGESTSGAH